MELAGHECVGFCEFDKFATASYTSMHLISDTQRQFLEQMPLKQRQKEILEEKYRNGEWYVEDIRAANVNNMPAADCWCAGFPCQDISVAGKQLGFAGNRSSLYFQIIRLLKSQKEEDRPQWIFLENVKNLLSVSGGWDFARVLAALDEVGYDCQWQVLNSKEFGVPQNRERVFIVGHSRRWSGREIFPVERTTGENGIVQIGKKEIERLNNTNQLRVYEDRGITPCLCCAHGGGRELHMAIKCNRHGIGGTVDIANALMARDHKGLGNQDMTAVAIPVLTPDRVNKRQNGRRYKENNNAMFTLTGQDRHGVMVRISSTVFVHGIWYDKLQCYIAIRRLTPKECFRLQGWTDEYFQRAAMVTSENQLYKQAGNGVTVSVIQVIAEHLTS